MKCFLCYLESIYIFKCRHIYYPSFKTFEIAAQFSMVILLQKLLLLMMLMMVINPTFIVVCLILKTSMNVTLVTTRVQQHKCVSISREGLHAWTLYNVTHLTLNLVTSEFSLNIQNCEYECNDIYGQICPDKYAHVFVHMYVNMHDMVSLELGFFPFPHKEHYGSDCFFRTRNYFNQYWPENIFSYHPSEAT